MQPSALPPTAIKPQLPLTLTSKCVCTSVEETLKLCDMKKRKEEDENPKTRRRTGGWKYSSNEEHALGSSRR